MNSIYDITVKDRKGNAVPLKGYANEVVLIVNTATKSPHTPQYEELEAIYEKHHPQGFAVLDFPSNQPTKSCPGTDEMIHQFCKETYNTEFPRFKKVKVNGADADKLYKYLTEKFPGEITEDFTKFLVNKIGKVVARYDASTPISEIDAKIKEML
ncbi:MAG: glutathione peroxidase [Prevotella sp.]|uniref:Glutathione peroxidase n=1 Tax=uncultured Prevotella sp. TaxID=159272 RepID=A0A6G8F114_9BACT|nr:glutathione peroxidase [Prevotella sp.]QIM09980.1 glutathione peroxidase [uncultured Prevotella sp.]